MSEQVQIYEWRGALDSHPQSAKLGAAMARGGARQVLSLRHLTLINSAGLGFLIRARRRLGDQGGELVLSEASPQVARSLAALGLDELFHIFDREEEAVAHFRNGAGPAGVAAVRVSVDA